MLEKLCLVAAVLLATATSASAIDLNVWTDAQYSPSSGFAPGADLHKKLYDEFEAANPDIKLHYQVMPSGPQSLQYILTGASSHNLPDAAVIDGQWISRLVQAHVVQPLDKLWPAKDQADFHPDVLKAETFDSKPYAIQFQTGMRGLVYRPSVLKTVGMEAPPSNWADFLAAAKTFKDHGMTEVLLPAKAVDEPSAMHFLSTFWGLGGELVDDKGAPVLFSGDNAKYLEQTFQMYRDLVSSGAMLPNVSVMDEAAIRPYFYSGEVAVAAQSSSSVKQIWTDDPDTKGDLAVVNYPMPAGKKPVTILGGFSYALIATDPARQQAAWKFIQFMTAPDHMAELNETLGQLPVRGSIWKTNSFFNTDPLMQKYKALYDGPMKTRPSVPIYPAISAAISTQLSQVVSGSLTPQDAVAKVKDAVMAEYKRQQNRG